MKSINQIPETATQPKTQCRVSFFEKLAYGMGGGGEVLMANLLFLLAYPIYQAGWESMHAGSAGQ